MMTMNIISGNYYIIVLRCLTIVNKGIIQSTSHILTLICISHLLFIVNTIGFLYDNSLHTKKIRYVKNVFRRKKIEIKLELRVLM